MGEVSTLTERENYRKQFWIAAAAIYLGFILFGTILLWRLDRYFIHIVAVSVGIPFALLVLGNRTRRMALVLLLALVPFVGVLKAITTSRFAPLTFDLAIAVG